MRGAVEPLPSRGITESEVRAAIDDQGLGAELFGESRRVSVRQTKKDHVVAAQHREFGGFDYSLGQRNQMRMVLTQSAACTGSRRHCTNGQSTIRERRMSEQQAEDLTSCVTAGTGNRNPYRIDHSAILHDYALDCKFIL